MKTWLYIVIFLIPFFSNCTKSNNVELKDDEHASAYSSTHTEMRKFDSITGAADFIFWENFDWRREKYNNLQDVSAHFTEYRLISEEVLKSIHGGFYTKYIIKGDEYTVMLHEIHGDDGGYKIYPVEFELNEANYLNFFPYRTMDEYLADENFGEVHEIKEDAIVYLVPIYTFGLCTLKFSGGLLKSIEYFYHIS